MIAIKYFKISMQIKRVVLLSPATRMLITLLTEIKSAVNDLKTQVARNTQLLQTVHSSVPDALEEVDIDLPLPDKPSLESLEQEIIQNKGLFKSLVRTLKWKNSRLFATLFSDYFKQCWIGKGLNSAP